MPTDLSPDEAEIGGTYNVCGGGLRYGERHRKCGEAVMAAVAEEREACAQVCQALDDEYARIEKTMTLYYIETGRGCCIRRALSEEQAERNVLREVGTYEGVRFVREATPRDIAWVRGMGGRVPVDYEQGEAPCDVSVPARKDDDD